MGLLDAVDAAWALGLGCQVDLLRVPGAHLVAGGPGMQGYDAIFMVRIDDTVLVYCPEPLRTAAKEVLGRMPGDQVFTAHTCERIASGPVEIRGPAAAPGVR